MRSIRRRIWIEADEVKEVCALGTVFPYLFLNPSFGMSFLPFPHPSFPRLAVVYELIRGVA